MNLLSIFDSITKTVAGIGAAAGAYVFLTENVDDVVPAVLTAWGVAYGVLLGVAGALIAGWEIRFWNGPVHRRPSFAYRLALTRRDAGLPTRWEIIERVRRRDQIATVAFGVAGSALLGPAAYLAISEQLREGFPVERWSTIWFMGTVAIAATLLVLLGLGVVRGRARLASRRRRRCYFCGAMCPGAARICATCSEPFPSWQLLRPVERKRWRG